MIYTLRADYLKRASNVSQKNGRTYYSILVTQGNEVQSMAVSADLYDRAADVDMMTTLDFTVRPYARTGGQTGSFLTVSCLDWKEAEDWDDPD